MKSVIVAVSVTVLMMGSKLIDSNSAFLFKDQNKYIIVIHGGVGTISREMPDSIKEDYLRSLSEALTIGKTILHNGGTSLDAVEQVVKFLENDPKFNAGKGAVYTSEGTHELDASIMDGRDLSCGAVAGVRTIKNPISLARLVMEKTSHVLLVGEGAETFGKKMNVQLVPNNYFDTPKRFEQWQKAIQKETKGTVGCVALDIHGNLAAATSTGGVVNKIPGRVGDSPIIGAGTYADNLTCAVSCSGKGELFIKHSVAYNISALMKYKNYSLNDAAEEMIHNYITEGDGGLIAVDKNGNYAIVYNTTGMFRGIANSEGIFEIKIWD
ncbi:MAG: beta-aspartyl-peptidase [Ignavibacteria bacterium RIFOXYB2_FULL_35_12]|nr:MAG: beta-aspartyl-peptidase [Ignavibacteria bacterium GWA2_36_19]OGU63036.1 MAG: beta-aspartyl-peptidase [Ignavibacteria bacterium GWF2_35_20]OGU88975.1 MAG: beta-aspartyl-peptidase [Ignavibacteria bacterium RIFOXYA12_FULL_35_25]OGU90929.1 MAG: beta-aspartyl-peptidase [Ignavibacteria bacterium RIFOXYC12_FULL_35_11]OGU94875.1 MAG: beta-aspartyl-peptidase [Ignavibacteria bacterium RIFOXYB12_FULL_35_14]OGU98433.1 MAG: beta-aspartyl-peptidase [Ignavibacteria bacterium RIFOXYC2_FULL_35_16]OGV0